MDVSYPIAIDNNYAIWRDFDNNYWPALYLIDGRGQIRYHQFGEGEYERSETVIQTLLAKNGGEHIPGGTVTVQADGAEASADWATCAPMRTTLAITVAWASLLRAA